jgi:hypothetical protein
VSEKFPGRPPPLVPDIVVGVIVPEKGVPPDVEMVRLVPFTSPFTSVPVVVVPTGSPHRPSHAVLVFS